MTYFKYILLVTILFGAGSAWSASPAVVMAADGCSSAGSACDASGSPGTCAQNPDNGDFYCRPSALGPPAAASPSPGSNAFVPLAPIPGLTQGATATPSGLAIFFNNLYKFCVGLAAALAVIMIIWGGLEISTQDSISKQGEGRERITQAIYGLILVLSPVLVFTIVNPRILNLSLNLPPVNTSYRPYTPTPTPTPQKILPGTETLRDVGVTGSTDKVGDKVIDKVPPYGSVSPTQYQQAANQYQQAMRAATADCIGAGGSVSLLPNGPDSKHPAGSVTVVCTIQSRPQ